MVLVLEDLSLVDVILFDLEPLRTYENRWEPLIMRTYENCWEPLRTYEKHWEPLRTYENH